MQIILKLLGIILASCYFFPFELKILPGINSKMTMAGVGLALLIINLSKRRDAIVDHGFIQLTLWAFGLSFISIFSCIFNNTRDFSFMTYFISMWVWLGGAYSLVKYIKFVHHRVEVPLISNYLIVVCVLQCVLALIFNYFPQANLWFENTFGGEAYMGVDTGERLHGIGCALDVAGFRFASVLIISTFLLLKSIIDKENIRSFIYLIALGFILIVGDMISRSTFIGLVIGLAFTTLASFIYGGTSKFISSIAGFSFLAIFIVIILYNSNDIFRQDLRFGFEGFFSFFEEGEWKSNSNEILKNMWIWPDNLKTWIIGDGYAMNPSDPEYGDPYYIGPTFHGFYMQTDIGYCRYIFYFGLIGLSIFIGLFTQAAVICIKRFENYKWIFIMILILNFVEWIKVSTDLFVVFAPFLCISPQDEKYSENFESERLKDLRAGTYIK